MVDRVKPPSKIIDLRNHLKNKQMAKNRKNKRPFERPPDNAG